MPAEAFADPWPVDRIPRRQAAVFHEVVEEFLAFIADAPLVIHNASFDISFINAELERIKRPAIARERLVDTLLLARRKHPGVSNRLDDLCSRYSIDNSRRTKHGALLDAGTAGRSAYRPDRGAAVATHPGFGDRSDPGPRLRRYAAAPARSSAGAAPHRMLTVRLTAPLSPPSATSRSGTSISRRLNQLGLAPEAACAAACRSMFWR